MKPNYNLNSLSEWFLSSPKRTSSFVVSERTWFNAQMNDDDDAPSNVIMQFEHWTQSEEGLQSREALHLQRSSGRVEAFPSPRAAALLAETLRALPAWRQRLPERPSPGAAADAPTNSWTHWMSVSELSIHSVVSLRVCVTGRRASTLNIKRKRDRLVQLKRIWKVPVRVNVNYRRVMLWQSRAYWISFSNDSSFVD